MDVEGKSRQRSCSFCSFISVFVGGAMLVLLSCVTTLLVAKNYYASELCDAPKLKFSPEERWVQWGKIEIPGKDMVISRTVDENICYLMPKATPALQTPGQARALRLLHQPLSEELIEELAGYAAAEYCHNATTYLLQEIVPDHLDFARLKRQANATGAAPVPATGAEPTRAPRPAAVGPTAAPSGASALSYEQRVPRCEDILLDCPNLAGQVSSCYTGINGVFYMNRQCPQPNQFVVTMTKPPGRILKLMQNEWFKCVERRQNGLRC